MALTKPRIIELLLVTTLPTMFVARRGVPSIGLMVATFAGGALAAGGANAINMVADRDIDRLMHRTRNRPLVTGQMSPVSALVFALVLEVVAFLELLRQPYTGCNPRGLLLSRDKSLSKQLLAFHRIATPQFAVFRRGARFHVPRKLRFPLFVKSTVEDASLGIAQASVVEDAAKLKERIGFVHEQVKSDALVEEYIEGRELYVGVLGNERLTRLPVWEMVFGSMPDSLAAIATRKVKWDKRYQSKYGITTHAADDLPPAVLTNLDRLSRRIYRALGMSGYARMDFRVTAQGQVYVLEANANPNLEAAEDFAESARAAGTSYGELIERLMDLGLKYRAQWRATYG